MIFGKLDIKDLEDIKIPIPWILIWKLLISEEYRWKNIWKDLLIALINKCYDLSKEMWVRFIIVDSHNDAVLFYKKYWFVEISDWGKTKKMVFDLKIFDKFK
jgi:GNAT superfamily N-acetyltransferase